MSTEIDAVAFLEDQHEEVNDLFRTLERATGLATKARILREITEKLAVHAMLEEKVFYPAVKAKRTEDILLESLEEHLGIKRVIADLMDTSPEDETFDAKAKVLRELVEHHVLEEEGDLFPKVERLMDGDSLIAVAQEMALMQEEILAAQRSPLLAIPSETDHASAL
jgi:hemerythrin superfamily protein